VAAPPAFERVAGRACWRRRGLQAQLLQCRPPLTRASPPAPPARSWDEHLQRMELQLAACGVKLLRWSSHAWPLPAFDSNYRAWRRARGAKRPALPAPEALPALPAEVEAGQLPDPETIGRLLAAAASSAHAPSVEALADAAADEAQSSRTAAALRRLLASGRSTAQLLEAMLRWAGGEGGLGWTALGRAGACWGMLGACWGQLPAAAAPLRLRAPPTPPPLPLAPAPLQPLLRRPPTGPGLAAGGA
jgi:hypothetical protein